MAETTTTPTKETEEGQVMSTEQDIQGEAKTKECKNPAPKSTQLKRPRVHEKPDSWKKTKATKTSADPIQLTEGDLLDSGETIRDFTKDAFEELMTEQKTVLGALKAQLQGLQVRPPGMMTPHFAEGTFEAE